MGREFGGSFLGAGVITADSPATWDYSGLKAAMNEWHHIAMSYNGDTGRLKIWLDGALQDGNINCCMGPLVVRDSPLTIGQAGQGKSNEYFYGFIDELRVFKKILTASNARKLYRRPCGTQ
ncbi:hypothetical protein HOLleu_30415 [Holothuria leucospilota]|uniref:LamG domain-containing protein n=1 Tax=Holothuria leucospilota TaxID=206669 RepID=A0A9Q1BKA5_HOLLE|nr:hypothetical protein HOLleu_30415 [Holothuria leucospilota]